MIGAAMLGSAGEGGGAPTFKWIGNSTSTYLNLPVDVLEVNGSYLEFERKGGLTGSRTLILDTTGSSNNGIEIKSTEIQYFTDSGGFPDMVDNPSSFISPDDFTKYRFELVGGFTEFYVNDVYVGVADGSTDFDSMSRMFNKKYDGTRGLDGEYRNLKVYNGTTLQVDAPLLDGSGVSTLVNNGSASDLTLVGTEGVDWEWV